MRGFAGKIRNGLTYSNVVATIALFIALGGGAYAVSNNSVGTPQLKNNAVKAKKIAKNAVTAPKIKANAVRSKQIAPGSVKRSDVALGAIGPAQIGTAAIYNRASIVTINSTANSFLVDMDLTVPPSGLVAAFSSAELQYDNHTGGAGCFMAFRPPGAPSGYPTLIRGSHNHPNWEPLDSTPGEADEGGVFPGGGGWTLYKATPGAEGARISFNRIGTATCRFRNIKVVAVPVV